MISLANQISEEHIDIQANSKLLKTKKHWQQKEDSTGYEREILITTPKRIWKRKRNKRKSQMKIIRTKGCIPVTRYRKQSSILFCKNKVCRALYSQIVWVIKIYKMQ